MFITLEGIEGCGKSLQVGRLQAVFEARGTSCRFTREPGGTPFGEEVRKILLRRDSIQRVPPAELLLYLADRCQHLAEVVEPALQSGQHVMSDRYHDATLAYQGCARGIGFESIEAIAKVLSIRTPDLTLVIDIDVDTALQRARSRTGMEDSGLWGRFEAEKREFHARVLEGYKELRDQHPERIFFVDGSGTPEDVTPRLVRHLVRANVLPQLAESR